MKKTIATIWCAVLFMVLIPVCAVSAERESDKEGIEPETEYVYTALGNRVKRRDEELTRKYEQGVTMEPEQVRARKERVEELGLQEYADGEYFLRKAYVNRYSIDELEKKGLTLLVKCLTEEEITAWEERVKSGISQRMITTGSDVLAWTNSAGITSRTYAFEVDGHIAFCGDAKLTPPATGAKHSDYILVTNAQIKKILYYGYGGPEDQMTKLGYSKAKSYNIIAISISNIRKGLELGAGSRIFWDAIKDLPDPPEGDAYYVDTYDSNLQDIFFYIVPPKKGVLQIQKSSANTAVTDGNVCYSLKGAEYGVYSNANGVSGYIDTLVIGEDGLSQQLELDAGVYYVKETKAPPGFALDTQIHQVEVGKGVTAVCKTEDQPQMNPIGLLIQKFDAEMTVNRPQGDGTLAGAQFTVKFYSGLWEKDKDPADLGKTPLRTWVFETDSDGYCYYTNDYKISGDALYQSSGGLNRIPLGTLTIEETKAPEGYHINQIIKVLQITSEGTKEVVFTYQIPVIRENIIKLELVKKQEGTNIVIPNVQFQHTKPDGKTELVKTDSEGTLTLKGLRRGVHKLKEMSVMDGYLVNGNIISFTVAEDHQITWDFPVEEEKGKITFELTKEQNIRVEVEDRLAPFGITLHKVNEKGKKLEGAEFTIFRDKACETQMGKGTSDHNGQITFQDLEIGKKYYIKETKAPKGYRLTTDIFGKPVVYEVYAESTPVEDKFTFYVDGKAYTSESDPKGAFTVTGTKAAREGHMTIENKIGRLLPNTGSGKMLLILLAEAVCFAFVYSSCNKEKSVRKENIVKKLYVVAVVAALIGAMFRGLPASAANTAQGTVNYGNGTASITITGKADQSLIGKKFQIYQLFEAENAVGGESINYKFHAPFANALKTVVGKKIGKTASAVTEYEVIDYIQTLNTNPVEGAQAQQKPEGSYSRFRYFIEELRNEIVKEGAAGESVNVTSVRDGNSVVIKGLPYGYYVVDEITSVEGTHAAASLCMVNTLNPGATVQIKSDYPSVSKKIQEDDKRESVGENGWNDMADFEIGQTVPYKFVSHVPDMNGYHTYYYAWHDVMNPALTFQPGSVSIVIRNTASGKTYTLKMTEFKVVTNPGNGETFKVEIKDLKAIVDREFDQMNELSENIYGQEVVLRYQAVLNDQAAENTGRPGFENDVKLEFSNNPDGDGEGETGETPWDTVVCFTYKLNGLKTNNHDLKLEGAKFRLYSDQACKNEVYVKKTANGYNVINRDSVGGNDHTGGTVPPEAVEMISSKTGVFTVFGLDGGTYWLKETKAPAGYRPILDPIKVEVIPTFVSSRDFYVKGQGATDQALKKLEFAAHIRQFLDGMFDDDTIALQTNIENGDGNLTVVNQVGRKLPVTGSVMMIVMIGSGAAAMFYALFRKRREGEEK